MGSRHGRGSHNPTSQVDNCATQNNLPSMRQPGLDASPLGRGILCLGRQLDLPPLGAANDERPLTIKG